MVTSIQSMKKPRKKMIPIMVSRISTNPNIAA
jgi:hypothetical protein